MPHCRPLPCKECIPSVGQRLETNAQVRRILTLYRWKMSPAYPTTFGWWHKTSAKDKLYGWNYLSSFFFTAPVTSHFSTAALVGKASVIYCMVLTEKWKVCFLKFHSLQLQGMNWAQRTSESWVLYLSSDDRKDNSAVHIIYALCMTLPRTLVCNGEKEEAS